MKIDKRECLLNILQERSLVPVFQPIIALHNGEIIGYEGLVRGPANSLLLMPQELFETAIRHDL